MVGKFDKLPYDLFRHGIATLIKYYEKLNKNTFTGGGNFLDFG